jgi:Fe-Mn family superoxide dismutase
MAGIGSEQQIDAIVLDESRGVLASHSHTAAVIPRNEQNGFQPMSDTQAALILKARYPQANTSQGFDAHHRQWTRLRTCTSLAIVAYSELTRRLGFEYNGMVLHEYYFQNLKRGGSGMPDRTSAFAKAAKAGFGSFEVWKTDFTGVGKMRGVGWAICYQNPNTGTISNHWVTLA